MRWGEEPGALLAWAWRHRYALGLTTAAAIAVAFPLEQQDGVRAMWAALDGLQRGSRLGEGSNSRRRPHLVIHRGANQGLLDLLACYLHHRVFTRGRRAGQRPLHLAGLPAPDDWLVVLGFALKHPPSPAPVAINVAVDAPSQTVNRKVA